MGKLNQVADGVWVRQSEWVWTNSIAVRGEDGLILIDPGIHGSELEQLADDGLFYVRPRPIPLDDKASALLDPTTRRRLAEHAGLLAPISDWRPATLEAATRDFAAGHSLKVGQIAQPLRAALTGATVSPPIFEVMAALGRRESLTRLADVAEREATRPTN